MCTKETNLGFTDKKIPVGTHMCLVFTEEKERVDSLLKFILSGLNANERVACFTEQMSESFLSSYLKDNHISYDECKKELRLTVAGTSQVYFENGEFNPDRMLSVLSNFYKESLEKGFNASRVIGEMVPEVEKIKGGDRLLEYESRVTLQLRDEPVTAVCQYDANKFDGATIMEVLKVHPQMIVNGEVVNNPFYIEPEEYLAV